MRNDRDQALTDAEEAAVVARQSSNPGTPHGARLSVYVLEGCDCLEQGGRDYRYHLHTFTPAGYFAWRATRQDLTIIKQIDC